MKNVILCFIMISLLLITGCGAKNEIEHLGIVVAMGIDTTFDGKYLVSLQILKTQKQPSGGMGGQKSGKKEIPADVEIITASGDTIYTAFDNLSTEFGKKILLSHMEFVVIGEELAKSGVASVIDFGLRSHQIRSNTPILVTRGKASGIINTATPQDPIPAYAIVDILAQQSRYGYSPVTTYLDFANFLSSKTASPIAGVIDLPGQENTGGVVKVESTAVFNKDKLIGYMDGKETRGLQWLKGKVKDGSIVIPAPDKGKLTLRVTKAGSKIKPVIHNNRPVIQVTVTEEGYIGHMEAQLDPMKEPGIIQELDQMQNKAIKEEIDKALYAAQKKFKVDLFEFGDIIQRDYPHEWRSLEKNWSEIFPDLAVEITVDSHIRRPGIISKPLY